MYQAEAPLRTTVSKRRWHPKEGSNSLTRRTKALNDVQVLAIVDNPGKDFPNIFALLK
jgi:hypothetical protein